MKGTCEGLFITDLDGTLLRSDGTFAQSDIDALERLSRCRVKTAIATGRSLYSFLNSPGVDLPVDYIIFTTGAGVVTQHERKLLYQLNLSSEMVSNTLDYLDESMLDFMMHHPVPDNHRYSYRRINLENPDFDRRIERYREFGKPLDSSLINGSDEAAQFLAVVPPSGADDALRQVRSDLPGLSIIRSTSPLDHESTWIEFFHPRVSKGKTAAWLIVELGIDHADTMAIGNDYNDMDLLGWAASSYVVGNAPEDIKKEFRAVASNDDCGVAEAVNHWLNEK